MATSHFQIAEQATVLPSLMTQWNEDVNLASINLVRPPITDLMAWGKNIVYSALLVNMSDSLPSMGNFSLGGRSQPKGFQLDAGGIPQTTLCTTLWGNYQRSTWCFGIVQAINEAIASNSRGPVQEVVESSSVHWLILHLPIPFDKLANLMQKQLIMTGTERNQIPSPRIYGDIDGCKVTAVDLCEQHAIDIDIWGKIKLGSWRKGTSHCCTECGAQGPNGGTISTWNLYCANCWAGHFSKRHCA